MKLPLDRISLAFARSQRAQRAALIPYMVAGYPRPAMCVPLMHAFVAAGADLLELGVPFSDPMADGPVIQRASERALEQGMSLQRVLDAVAQFRQDDVQTPVVLMGYANPIERMGQQRFAAAAQHAGVDGVLVVDYPEEESRTFAKVLAAHGIALIFLLAPTTSDVRAQAIGRAARGYAYYVSLTGVTGAGHFEPAAVAQRLLHLRQHVAVPLAVGFGIRDAASVARIAPMADAVVIGSKLLEIMDQVGVVDSGEEQHDAVIAAVCAWLREIRPALNYVKTPPTPQSTHDSEAA
jgi:tryptophan synthase alpha chain